MKMLQILKKYANTYLVPICLVLTSLMLCSYVATPISYVCVLAVVALLCLLNFENILCLLIYLLCFQDALALGSTKYHIFPVFLALGTIILFVKYLVRLHNKKENINILVCVFSLLLIAYSLIGLNFSGVMRIARFGVFIVLLYLLINNKDQYDVKNIVNYIVLAIIVNLIGGIILGLIPNTRTMVYFDKRFQGFVGHTNQLQLIVGYALMMILTLYIRGKLSKPTFVAYALLFILVGLLTMSKAFLIVAILAFVIYFIFEMRKNVKRGAIELLFVLVVAGCLFPLWKDKVVGLYNRFFEYYAGYGGILDSITTGRVQIWGQYFNEWMQSFVTIIFGAGVSGIMPVDIGPHNDFVFLIYHLGIIGCSLIIVLIISYLLPLTRKKSSAKFNWSSVIPVIIIALYSMDENVLMKNEMVLLVLLASMIFMFTKQKEKVVVENNNKKIKISVLTSVYKNDIAENVKVALESVINQTYKPSQIVLVRDGSVGKELQDVIDHYKKNKLFTIVEREENIGLGKTLAEGTKYCKYDYIARMDTDDIAEPNRFEKEVECFQNDPELSLVGSNGEEFINDIANVSAVKSVPETDEQIKEFIKSRCPFCHMSVMMKKQKLLDAGGYEDWYYAEDWYLWIRMCLAGAKFYNIQENLMHIRVNEDTYARRHGMKYYKSIKGLLKYMYQYKMISFVDYIVTSVKRFVGHVIIPKSMKAKLYRKYMRS